MIAPDPDLAGDLIVAAGDFALKPLEMSDAAELLAEFSDPRVVEWMDIEPLSHIDEARAIIDWAKSQRALGSGLRWSIRVRRTGAFVGTCGYNRITLERGRRGEIAYDLTGRWQGRGVMAAVLPATVEFGWNRLGLHRLEAFVTPGNARSCALLERHGFTREGVLAGYGFWKGRYFDQIVYGLTRAGAAPTL
ncbi:MAG TPA: GNAT family protein [Caulobacteraceae bacterium]|jgi:ribosomal-protein-alanine N-acetyltransferase